jgi:putative inorganic carbon (HCO3(-)) transporter
VSRLRRLLALPDSTSNAVVLTIVWYLGHLYFQGWVLSSELCVLGVLVCAIVALYRRDLQPSFHILYYPLFLYCLDSSVSALFAPQHIHSALEGALWGKTLLFPAAVILYRNVPRARDLSLNMILFFGAFISLYGLFQYFFLEQRDLEHRITGPASHVMTYSGLLLVVALLALVLWLHDLRNPILFGVTAVTTFSILLTFTRSVWVGWGAAVLVLLTLRKPRWLIFAPGLGILLLTFLPLSVFGRIASAFDTKQSSNLDRIRMVQAGVEIIKDYPLLGVGPGNVKEVYPLYRKHDAPRFRIPHLHNNLVQLWAERGVLALAAYLLLLALFLRECARGWGGPAGRWAEVGVVVTVGLFAAGMFEFNFGDTEVYLMMLDVLALVVAFLERPQPANEPTPLVVGPVSPLPSVARP